MTITTRRNTEIRVEGRLIRVARLELDKYEFLDDPEPVIHDLRTAGVRIDLFTFLQRISDTSPRYDYPMEWDNLAVLPVSSFDHWWKNQIRSYARNRARQAVKKGVVIREVPFDDALVRGIWAIYNECRIRQGSRFRHYGRDINWVRQHAGTFLDRSIFIGAFAEDRLIGFIKLVTDEARSQACTMHILSMVRHREKAPTNALIAHAVQCCADRGIQYLVYQNFAYGNKPPDGLSRFKEVNGFQRVDLPRYYVPLTALGRVALSLRLHHRFVDILPEALASRARECRRICYERIYPSAAEIS